jgi:uncharacterized protein (DUF305 family)
MEPNKTPPTRSVKKTSKPVTPEVKLQELHQSKKYDRNNEKYFLWAAVRIVCMVVLIIFAYLVGVRMWLWEFQDNLSNSQGVEEVDPMIAHCNLMPDMPGCEKYTHMGMIHDPMDMSMRDMGTMLLWKTGSGLERAFLEWMIPHHEGAILMAQYLTGNINPELLKMAEEIKSTQQEEINQMKEWLIEWWYASGATQTPEDKIAL